MTKAHLDDQAVDRALSAYAAPAPKSGFGARVVAEATRPGRPPAAPARRRATHRPWTRRGMILGVVMVNLLAVSAMAAIFGGHALVDKVATLAHRLFAPAAPVALVHTSEHAPRPTTHREARASIAPVMAAPTAATVDPGQSAGSVRPSIDRQRRAMSDADHPGLERTARRREGIAVARHVARPTRWHPDRASYASSRSLPALRVKRADQTEAARVTSKPASAATFPPRPQVPLSIDRPVDIRWEESGQRSPVDEPRIARERTNVDRRDRAVGERARQGRRFGAGQRGGFGRGRGRGRRRG